MLQNRAFIKSALGLGYPVKTLAFLKNISKYSIAGDEELIKVDFIGLQKRNREIVFKYLFVPYLNDKIIDYDTMSFP